jgi:hypothetical protein
MERVLAQRRNVRSVIRFQVIEDQTPIASPPAPRSNPAIDPLPVMFKLGFVIFPVMFCAIAICPIVDLRWVVRLYNYQLVIYKQVFQLM